MGASKRYVYGITDDPPDRLPVDGVEGATEVFPVSHRSHAAIVSDIGTLEPEESEENVRAHDEVLRGIATCDGGRTVVPMRFGMDFEGAGPLKNVLRSSRVTFESALRGVEGCLEFGVKVVAPAEGDVDEAAIREAVDSQLDPLAERTERGERFSDRLVLNRTYLVDRDRREAFDEAVGDLEEQFGDVDIQYSGPWAPYSFVDVEIGVVQ